jgi:hypothetical protein
MVVNYLYAHIMSGCRCYTAIISHCVVAQKIKNHDIILWRLQNKKLISKHRSHFRSLRPGSMKANAHYNERNGKRSKRKEGAKYTLNIYVVHSVQYNQ